MDILVKTQTEKKIIIAFAFAVLMALQGCLKSKPAFTGTYVNSASSVFSVAFDTLVVEMDQGNNYVIERRTGFQLLDDQGKAGKWQHEAEHWRTVYDAKREVMTETRNGKVITFNTDQGTMTVGKRKYKRIK